MSHNLNLRTGAAADAAVIAEIFNESVAAVEQKTEQDFRDLVEGAGPGEKLLLLELDQSVVGWGLLQRYSNRGGYRFCGETMVYLRRDKRREGYGTKIKQALIQQGRQLNYHHLLARVNAGNTAGIEYNRKLGYEVVGIQKEICFREGRWEDVVVLQSLM